MSSRLIALGLFVCLLGVPAFLDAEIAPNLGSHFLSGSAIELKPVKVSRRNIAYQTFSYRDILTSAKKELAHLYARGQEYFNSPQGEDNTANVQDATIANSIAQATSTIPINPGSTFVVVTNGDLEIRVRVLEQFLQNMGNRNSKQNDVLMSQVARVVGSSSNLPASADFTSLSVSSSFSASGLTACDSTTEKLLWANGIFLCGTDATGSGGGAFPFTTQSWGVSTTTTVGLFNGFISNASSTINANLVINGNSTTTSATTTNSYSTTASSTNLFATVFGGGNVTSSGLGTFANLLLSGSSTLQNFTFVSATGTRATTTDLFSTTASSTNLFSSVATLSSAVINSLTVTSCSGCPQSNSKWATSSADTLAISPSNALRVGIGTTTPKWALQVASSTGPQLTLSDPSTLTNNPWSFRTAGNSFYIATSSPTTFATSSSSFIAFNVNAATTTVSFFGATSTGLTAGSGLGLSAALRRQIIVGDGKTQAGMAIVFGGVCVDNDGWCSASTTGRISSVTSTTGGSDLAEVYPSRDATLEAGEVVSIDVARNVVRADSTNISKLAGVISTDPGVIMGLNPGEESSGNEYPVAFAGRVPVKVSTENGVIIAGDYLTLSSVPGVAARALKAGVVVGQALEDFTQPGTGKVLVFIKNSYYSGVAIDKIPGLTLSGSLPTSMEILAGVVSGALKTPTFNSEITTDRLLAGIEIITPKLTAQEIYADKVSGSAFDSILQRLSSLESAAGVVIQSGSEWLGSKVSAALGVFTKVETETAKISKGLELVDNATGKIYCITITNGELDKREGECTPTNVNTPSPTPTTFNPEPVPVVEPEPVPEVVEAREESPEEPSPTLTETIPTEEVAPLVEDTP